MRLVNLMIFVVITAAFVLVSNGVFAATTDSDETSKSVTDSFSTSTTTELAQHHEARSLRTAAIATGESWSSAIIAKIKDLYWKLVMKIHLMQGSNPEYVANKYWQSNPAKYAKYRKQYEDKWMADKFNFLLKSGYTHEDAVKFFRTRSMSKTDAARNEAAEPLTGASPEADAIRTEGAEPLKDALVSREVDVIRIPRGESIRKQAAEPFKTIPSKKEKPIQYSKKTMRTESRLGQMTYEATSFESNVGLWDILKHMFSSKKKLGKLRRDSWRVSVGDDVHR